MLVLNSVNDNSQIEGKEFNNLNYINRRIISLVILSYKMPDSIYVILRIKKEKKLYKSN